jgi:hypothetical protein
MFIACMPILMIDTIPFFWFKLPEHPGLGGTSQAVREGLKVMFG